MLAHSEFSLFVNGDAEDDGENTGEHDQGIVRACLLRNYRASIDSSQDDQAIDQCEDHRYGVQRGLRSVSGDGRMLRGKFFVVGVGHVFNARSSHRDGGCVSMCACVQRDQKTQDRLPGRYGSRYTGRPMGFPSHPSVRMALRTITT